MREIKFRVFDIEEKRMYYPEYNYRFTSDVPASGRQYNIYLNGDLYDGKSCKGYAEFKDEYILQQYTGLKDKNGKEIYEGDIVKQYFYDQLYYNPELLTNRKFSHR